MAERVLPYPLYALGLAGALVATIRRVGAAAPANAAGSPGRGGERAGSPVTSPR